MWTAYLAGFAAADSESLEIGTLRPNSYHYPLLPSSAANVRTDGLGCFPFRVSSYNGRRSFKPRTGTSTSRPPTSSEPTQSRDTTASPIGVAEGEITVAISTVFILNAVALYLFPVLGHALHLSQVQFGTWEGVAIHDISSVVGAASHYGLSALQTATAIKLSRTLWIIPVAFGAAYAFRPSRNEDANTHGVMTAEKPKVKVPWFVSFFLLASMGRSYVPGVAAAAPTLSHMATVGLTLTLFLIGAGLSAKTLR